jgi:hypothetical protein
MWLPHSSTGLGAAATLSHVNISFAALGCRNVDYSSVGRRGQ